MGRPYAQELATLPDSIAWAQGLDTGVLARFVRLSRGLPLVAVGSGGSAAAAHFAALLHRHYTLAPAQHATPLEVLLTVPMLAQSAVLLLSASGRNQDVLFTSRAAIGAEVPALACITASPDNPLSRNVEQYTRGFPFAEQIPTGKDGFLATNSLIGTLVVLARAYELPAVTIDCRPPNVEDLGAEPARSAIVLHAGWSSPIATDLESRLHESTLLNAQTSDYRNFGHGRHLWLARRSEETIVVALVTPETKSLADRTLRHIPTGVPVIRLSSQLEGPWASVELLASALHWTGALSESQSIDPGRPQVPGFGRRLFHLRPPRLPRSKTSPAIRRKLLRLGSVDDATEAVYENALTNYVQSLERAEFGAVVLDYDGTLCPTEHRFGPLPPEMATECCRLLNGGLRIGVATGRGKSVREALKTAIPSELWSSVLIGYYSGSDVAALTDDHAPNKQRPRAASIASFAEILTSDPLLSELAEVEVRPCQITVSLRASASPADLQAYISDLLVLCPTSLQLLRSGHSIDLIPADVSKTQVVERVGRDVAPRSVLCIGDQGAWPGNDSQLLGHEFSLSVDQVSSSLQSCWNLAPQGVLGAPAALLYLRALQGERGSFRFLPEKISGGST